jgi:hypothetical protein
MVRIVEALSDTGFGAMPTDKELSALLKIVFAAHADVARAAARESDFQRQFRDAFLAVGYLFRLDEPSSKRYFSAFVEDAGEWLVRLGRSPVQRPRISGGGHCSRRHLLAPRRRERRPPARGRARSVLWASLQERLARYSTQHTNVATTGAAVARADAADRAEPGQNLSREQRRSDGRARRFGQERPLVAVINKSESGGGIGHSVGEQSGDRRHVAAPACAAALALARRGAEGE